MATAIAERKLSDIHATRERERQDHVTIVREYIRAKAAWLASEPRPDAPPETDEIVTAALATLRITPDHLERLATRMKNLPAVRRSLSEHEPRLATMVKELDEINRTHYGLDMRRPHWGSDIGTRRAVLEGLIKLTGENRRELDAAAREPLLAEAKLTERGRRG